MVFFDNEEAIRLQNEELTDEIITDMLFYGHTVNGTNFFDSKEFEKLMIDFIKSKKGYVYNFDLPARPTKVIREQANKALIMQTADIDRRVLYTESDEKLIHDFEGEYNIKLDETTIDEFIKYVKKHVRKKEVTSLPIRWRAHAERNGFAASYSYPDDSPDIIEKYPIISTGIVLLNQNDDLGSPVLAHEMTHALVNRHKGIVENRMHQELLSIYMELVVAYELDESENLLNNVMLHRLQAVKHDVIETYTRLYSGIMLDTEAGYVDSSLYAFALFEQYRKSSSSARAALRNELNKTLSGKRTLEDTIDALSITEEEGSNVMRGHIKRLMK